ncbi:Ger(x)C family spore germination protein [Ammoniphilus sp. 3BR4]|uniref:Ger(x)C family spore germination protein n=1 Tax=Ammoniphilus sp. 3BR4 TaxID=3158265 RepID=UPI003465E403
MNGWRNMASALGVFLLLFAAGCWDRQEIEERTSVVAVALDQSKEGKGLLRLTVQIPIPKKIAGSGASGGAGGGGREAVRVMSATGYTLSEASRNLQKRLNQEIFYGHTRIIAVGEDLAREGIDTVVDALRRTPQIRRLLWPVVVKGEALQLLQSNPRLEQIPMMYLMDLLNNNAKMGTIPDVSLGRFFIHLSDSSREPGMNMVEATSDEVKWVGLAIFEESKMIGQLDPREVVSLLQIRDEKIGGTIEGACEGEGGKKVAFSPKTIKTEKKYRKRAGEMGVQVKVRLEGDIMESQCSTDLAKQETLRDIQMELEAEMEQRADRLLRHLQKEVKQDLFAFGMDIRAKHPDWWDPKKWEEEFLNMKMDVKYEILIRRTGMEMR